MSPWYLTYLQAKSLGGHVRRGEKGAHILKYGEHLQSDDDLEVPSEDLPGRKKFVKRYAVFNSSQIEGIEFPEIEPFAPENLGEALDPAEAIIASMPRIPGIQEGRKAIPSYDPNNDEIDIPGREFFTDLKHFYLTLFHELIHSTGHPDRLARPSFLAASRKNRETTSYAEEELVAELGAAFLSERAGFVIDDHRDSAGYVAGWLKAMEPSDDEQLVWKASLSAQKAVEFVLSHSE